VAGLAGGPGMVSGVGPSARFNGPRGVAASPSQPSLAYVCDTGNGAVRAMDAATGSTTTVAVGLAGPVAIVVVGGSASDVLYVACQDHTIVRAVAGTGKLWVLCLLFTA
jgi:hypothetical protein